LYILVVKSCKIKKRTIGNKKLNNKRNTILNELSTHTVFNQVNLVKIIVLGYNTVLRINVKDKKNIIILIFNVNSKIIKRKFFKAIKFLPNKRIIALTVHIQILSKTINKLFSKLRKVSIYFNI